MEMKEVVITSGVRTPVGNFGCALRDVPVVQLGSKVIREVLKRNDLRPVPPKDSLTFLPKLLVPGMIELEI